MPLTDHRARLTVATLAAVLALTAVTVSVAAAAAPIVGQFHATFSDTNPTDNLCGIDGSSYDNGVENFLALGGGKAQDQFRFTYVFTSAATGKSVEVFIAQFVSGLEVDNPDGSVTFVTTYDGLPLTIKLPNGSVLSRDAGTVTFRDTFDADGNFISSTVDEKGPHPALDSDSAIFCDVIVPALS